jgi:hypothetical protein
MPGGTITDMAALAPAHLRPRSPRHTVSRRGHRAGPAENLRHLLLGMSLRVQAVPAVELPPEAAGKLLHDAFAGFSQRRLLRSLLGPSVRPPAAILYRYGLRIDDGLEDYVAHARRCPWFELLPREEAAKGT